MMQVLALFAAAAALFTACMTYQFIQSFKDNSDPPLRSFSASVIVFVVFGGGFFWLDHELDVGIGDENPAGVVENTESHPGSSGFFAGMGTFGVFWGDSSSTTVHTKTVVYQIDGLTNFPAGTNLVIRHYELFGAKRDRLCVTGSETCGRIL